MRRFERLDPMLAIMLLILSGTTEESFDIVRLK
jgi:hypothetical protein